MKILVNASTAVVGGTTQVAASFIESTIRNSYGNQFMYAVSSSVAAQLEPLCGLSEEVVVFKDSPAKLWNGRKSREKLVSLEESFHPDIIYSIAAPSYVRFRSTMEIARLTDPWVMHPNKLAFSTLSAAQSVYMHLLILYKIWKLRNIKYFNTQTKVSAEGLSRRLKHPRGNIRIIPNCQNALFSAVETEVVQVKEKPNPPIIFVLAHPYPHKNLDIVPDVANELKRRGNQAKFIVTLPAEDAQTHHIMAKASRLGVQDMMCNVGKLTLPECKNWYINSDLVLLPTLLETSSVTYLEAMAMERPIVTTDLAFTRDACGDAAEYYEPMNAEKAAIAIFKVLNDRNRYDQLVENGCNNLKKIPSQEEIYKAHICWVLDIAKKNSPAL